MARFLHHRSMAPRLTALCILLIAAAALAAMWSLALARAEPMTPAQLERACENGRVSSCVWLGVLHRHGRGGASEDPEKALAYLDKACKAGSRFACGYAGEMIYLGLVAGRSAQEGAALILEACAAGDFWSCETARRQGLTPDAEKADFSDSH